jgi:hypothetical protein
VTRQRLAAQELPDQLAVPEICQKLRYTRPRLAHDTTSDSASHLRGNAGT